MPNGHHIKSSRKLIKNAVIILIYKNKRNEYRVLMVNDKYKNKWMFPGGKINRRRGECVFECAKREFYEETSIKLNYFTKSKFIEYNHNNHTMFFIGFTKKPIPKGIIRTSETNKIDHASAYRLYKNKSKIGPIKGYVLKTYIQMMNHLVLNQYKFAMKILKFI
tara:strand:- start:3309 stop:3800 length:492 start_codon:yes stop_codon:yes gene_type:complete